MLTALFNLALNLVVVVVFLLHRGVDAALDWLEVPLLVALLGVLASARRCCCRRCTCASATSSRSGRSLLQIAVLRHADLLHDREFGEFQKIMVCTPFAAILTQLRYALVDPNAPTAAEVAGGWVYMLIPIGIDLRAARAGHLRVPPSRTRRRRAPLMS